MKFVEADTIYIPWEKKTMKTMIFCPILTRPASIFYSSFNVMFY